ncbi:LysR family transcriptional regulator [Pseudomonas sp. WHRI 8519]|uniref:LysR family transcriptional regulator n=1 Tax=Pseudomonas sp. WHRI 8519 TaxID=3162567 RepID=UPI0032F01E3A
MNELLRLPSLTALRAFYATARLGSMKEAASYLFVTPSSVSHQIRNLEEELRTELFERGFRSLKLTDKGRVLFDALHQAFRQISTGIERISQQATPAVLNVYTSPLFAAKWLLPRLSDFEVAHPQIPIRVETTQTVDLTHGNPDVILRYSNSVPDETSNAIHPLIDVTLIPVCSPDFFERNPIKSLYQLSQAVLLHDEGANKDNWLMGWQEFFSRVGLQQVGGGLQGKYFSNTYIAMESALASQGWVLAIEGLVRQDILSGRLVNPLDIKVETEAKYWLHVHNRLACRPEVDLFCTWIHQYCIAEAHTGFVPT